MHALIHTYYTHSAHVSHTQCTVHTYHTRSAHVSHTQCTRSTHTVHTYHTHSALVQTYHTHSAQCTRAHVSHTQCFSGRDCNKHGTHTCTHTRTHTHSYTHTHTHTHTYTHIHRALPAETASAMLRPFASFWLTATSWGAANRTPRTWDCTVNVLARSAL